MERSVVAGPPSSFSQVVGRLVEQARRDELVHECGRPELVRRHGAVSDRGAGHVRDGAGEVRDCPQRTPDLVGRAHVPVVGEHPGSGQGHVADRGEVDGLAAVGRPQLTGADGRGQARVDQCLGVEGVAQQGVRPARVAQQVLGDPVVGEEARAVLGVHGAGVDDPTHTGGHRGVDDVAVLARPDPGRDVRAGHEQQYVGAGEGGPQRLRVLVVAAPDLDPARREVGGLLRSAGDGDQLARGHPVEQVLDDDPAQFPGDAGDDDHVRSSCGWTADQRDRSLKAHHQ